MRNLLFFALAFVMLISMAFSENYVIINSKDGRDVLSGIFYANVKNVPVKFLPPNGEPNLLAAKVGGGNDMLLIESQSMPVSGFLESALKQKGNTITVLKSSDPAKFNLELAKSSGAKKFIVVDSAYAHNAVSALTYAARTDAYIIFADRANAEEVKGVLTGAQSIIVFGYVDKAVKDALNGMNVEYFGKGEDRFEDNVAMVGRTVKEFGDSQAWVMSGSFIEEGTIRGDYPILYISKLTPKVTYDYLKETTGSGAIKVYVVIGNDLVQPFHDTREKIKNEFSDAGMNKSFGILVKFAQTVPKYTEGTFGLDIFPVPVYRPSLEISGVNYNKASKKLEVVVKNLGEGPAYFTSEIRIKANGEDKAFIKDPQPVLVERGDSNGVEYDVTMPAVEEGTITADVLTRFGASVKSSEQFITFIGIIDQISFIDQSNIEIKGAKYDKANKNLLTTFRNPGEGNVFARSEVTLMIGGEETRATSEKVFNISAKSLYVNQIPVELTEKELEENNNITIKVRYGAREGFLKNEKNFSRLLEYEKGDNTILLIVGGAVVLAAVAFAASRAMGKKK